ncbi:glycoside hydrolase family 16 protein [Corynebacterium sp.]|uniref:glycoside hydrolase family 16 protein n=1 Tax=Corynebacterium sp. TaxID=1720 RepID=UPI0026DCD105|nr:glycoside hydrolase family 16 protein [Corynebacterium sp.]MDO5076780.1 glycoside hydrolase family 16 protein [Corynebacterium sp.]
MLTRRAFLLTPVVLAACNASLQTYEPYEGRPKSDPHVRWDPSMVRGNILYGAPGYNGWVTGGLSYSKDPKLYGRWDVRLRSFPHSVLSYHVLLWPKSDIWPPEIDIAENFRSDRQQTKAFVHGNGKQEFRVDCDATKPKTFAVEWRKDSIKFFCDDEMFGETTKDIPHEPMWLAIQVESHATKDGGKLIENNGVTREQGPPKDDYRVPVVEILKVSYAEL